MIANRHRFKGLVIYDKNGKKVTRSHNLAVFMQHKKKTGMTPNRIQLVRINGTEGQMLAFYPNGDNIIVDFQSYEVMQDYVRRKQWDIEELVETNLEERVEKMTNAEPKVYYTTRPLSERPDDLIYDFTDKEELPELKVTITKQLTPNDIENIIVTAFEGGIGYWARVRTHDENGDVIRGLLGGMPKGMPFSQWTTHLLLNGKHVLLYDREDEEEENFKLDLQAVLKGFAMINEKKADFDIETYDAGDADCMIQYGLFGKLVYG